METLRLRTVDGYDIAAVLHRAQSPDVVIWMHGISVNKDEYLGFFRDGASRLAAEGMSSIRFDFRGHGESSGSSLDFSVIGQNLDVRAVVAFAQQEFTSLRSIHLVGASFGAPPALFAAARYSKLIRTVCLIAPVLSYRRTFLEPETAWARELFSREHLFELDRTGKLYLDSTFCVGHRLVEEMRTIRPEAVLADLRQHILMLHGNRDSIVPYDVTARACRGLRHVKLITLDGADHGFVEEGDDEGLSAQSAANKELIFRAIEQHLQ